MEAFRKWNFFGKGSRLKAKLKRKKTRQHGGCKQESSENELSSNPPPPSSECSQEGTLNGKEKSKTNNSGESGIVDSCEQKDVGTSDSDEVSPTTVDLSSTDDEKLLKDMPSEVYEKLTILLQPTHILGKDYRLLADKMGYKYEYIKYLESLPQPVKELFIKFAREERRTIKELLSLLKQIDRPDVVEDLQPYIERTPPRRVIEERFQKSKIDEQKTIRDSYDAFICYDEGDRAFVDKLVKRMESEPYNRHVCDTRRDLLPGGSRFEGIATAIEKNCRNVVLVWSRNYHDSEKARFESDVAMSMSTGTKKKLDIIPVLIDDGYRDNIPRSMSHFYYLDYKRLEKELFWNKLAISLGWKPPNHY